jgi:hypothetical protein
MSRNEGVDSTERTTWPGRADLARMSDAEVNAFLASRGLDVRVEETARGWYAGADGLGARGRTREQAVEKLRSVQALVARLAAQWHADRHRPSR